MKAKLLLLSALLVAATTSADEGSKHNTTHLRRNLASTVTFNNPTEHGLALDWCLRLERQCGKPAADKYCQSKGYKDASQYPKERSYGKTMCIGDHAQCDPQHHGCDTFDYITCRRNEQTFNDPREHNRRLDWCYKFEMQCGKTAADAYCRAQGFSEATNYPKQRITNGETMTIGNHAVCDPAYHVCDTFDYIKCVI